MSTPGIIEAFDVIERISPGLVSRVVDFTSHPLLLSEEKKLSIAALSQQLPDLLIEQATP